MLVQIWWPPDVCASKKASISWWMPCRLSCRNFPERNSPSWANGPDAVEVERFRARRLGLFEKIDFRGFVRNPWVLMGHADLFILPSRAEGCQIRCWRRLFWDTSGGEQAIAWTRLRELHPVPLISAALCYFPTENAGRQWPDSHCVSSQRAQRD